MAPGAASTDHNRGHGLDDLPTPDRCFSIYPHFTKTTRPLPLGNLCVISIKRESLGIAGELCHAVFPERSTRRTDRREPDTSPTAHPVFRSLGVPGRTFVTSAIEVGPSRPRSW